MNDSAKPDQWLALLADPSSAVSAALRSIYGEDENLLRQKAFLLAQTVRGFASRYGGEAEMLLVRAPGRVNLLGTHIDHRGGFTNPIAIREVLLAAQAREDDQVVAHNNDEEGFPPRAFRITDELRDADLDDWEGWTQAQFQKRKEAGTAADWVNYVKAPLLYLQFLNLRHAPPSKPLKGMNLFFYGNVPMAAGLSSSSSIVVATAEAAISVNHLEIEPLHLVELCGQAEWFVGTRGGSADHAAIKLGRRGSVLKVGSFPVRVQFSPFPAGYDILLCNSLKEAKKTAGARNPFNERVAGYEIAFLLVQKHFPQYAPKLQHLRDIAPARLGVEQAAIYQILLKLPQSLTREEALQQLPDQEQRLQRIFSTHEPPPAGYRVRQICLYGIAECLRSELAAELLKRNDMRGFGELMNLSHEGDRLTRLTDGARVAHDASLSDERIHRLIADLRSGDRQRTESSRLFRQPGGYQVSCEELDELVDVSLSTPGVVGAGLVGAGLGGCIVAIVEQCETQRLVRNLEQGYYNPRHLPLTVEVCHPVAGAGIIRPCCA